MEIGNGRSQVNNAGRRHVYVAYSGGVVGGGGRGILQDVPEYNLIDCIHKTIFSNVLEAVKKTNTTAEYL